MRVVKISLLVLLLVVTSFLVTGCWNYREIDRIAIVAGVAIDKGEKEKYKITAEIIQVSGGSSPKTTSQLITMEGNSIFDAARNGISLTGKRLYWSHNKVIIISKKIAEKGVVSVMDWYNRDSETRFDVNILICKGDSASEILAGKKTTDQIKSFELNDMIKNQKSLSKAPQSDMVIFFNALEGEGIVPALPTIELKKINGKKLPSIMGTAVFKRDKLVGYLNSKDTKSYLVIKDEIKGGLIVEKVKKKDKTSPVTLEVFKSKTKVTPIINGKDVKMSIKIETETAIDEIDGETNVIDDKGRKKLESLAAETLKTQVEDVIKKVQKEYGADIFGFGSKVNQKDPEVWKRIGNDWDKKFKNLEVSVDAKVHIRNSAMLSKPLKVGE